MKYFQKTFFSFSILFLTGMVVTSCAALPKDPASGYTPSLKNPAQVFNVGKTVFDIVIKDANQAATPGLALEVSPEMTMTGGMSHTTPVESVVDNGDGSYTVTAYFIMASGGGSWALHFHVNGTHLADHIAITVGGLSADRGQLKGTTADFIKPDAMSASTNRLYYVFKSSINTAGGAGNPSIDLFLATREDTMTHPAVFQGQVLHSDTSNLATAWTVGTVTLSVCTGIWTYGTGTNSSCTSWANLFDQGNGHFTGTGLTIVDTSKTPGISAAQFAVHLKIVNATAGTNEWKTSGGVAGLGTGDNMPELISINQ